MAEPPSHPELPQMRRAARQATLLTALSGVVVLGALGYSAWQINALDKTLADRRAVAQQLEQDINNKQSQLNDLETRLQEQTAALRYLPAPEVKRALEKSASAMRPRVYIQIANDGQRSLAAKAADALKAAGYEVPGVESVGTRAPKTTTVRYFVRSEESRRQAEEVVKVLQGLGVDARAQLLSIPKASAQPRQIEIWFGSGS